MGPAGREARLHRGLLKLPLLSPSLVRAPPPPAVSPNSSPQKQWGWGGPVRPADSWTRHLAAELSAGRDLQLALNILEGGGAVPRPQLMGAHSLSR